MGKEIERLAAGRNVTIKQVFTSENNTGGVGLTKESLQEIDVCIDFSTPWAILDNIRAVADCGKNIVIGTTGWYDKLNDIEKFVKAKKIGLIYSPNFAVGMNIFYQVLTLAAHYFNKFNMYDVAIHETHHRGKADSPSGTALALAQLLLQQIHCKKEVMHETAHKQMKPEQIHVTSTRVGHVIGSHRVLFDSEADTIELVHTAKNRDGFALGALFAAEWLRGKKGMFTMKDVLTSL